MLFDNFKFQTLYFQNTALLQQKNFLKIDILTFLINDVIFALTWMLDLQVQSLTAPLVHDPHVVMRGGCYLGIGHAAYIGNFL